MSKVKNTPIALIPAEDCYKLDGEIIKSIYQRFQRERKAYNKMQTYLRDRIRGSFFTAIKTLINDAIKLAKNANLLLEQCKLEFSKSMLGDYIAQSGDTANRHIKRMKELGFLVEVKIDEQEKEAMKGKRRFNSKYQIDLNFLQRLMNPTPSAPAPTPNGDGDQQNTTATPSEQAPSDQQPGAAMATTPQPTMTVVHNAHKMPMTVVHSTCEQVEKQQNNATVKRNSTNVSTFSFRNRIFVKCLILKLLKLSRSFCIAANCPPHLTVKDLKDKKTTIRAVDMWISFREGERYKTIKELTAKKNNHCTEAVEFLTDKGRFYSLPQCGEHLKRFGARAARRAA